MAANVLEPFPLCGVTISLLQEIVEEIEHHHVKFSIKITGKEDLSLKSRNKLEEKISAAFALKGGANNIMIGIKGNSDVLEDEEVWPNGLELSEVKTRLLGRNSSLRFGKGEVKLFVIISSALEENVKGVREKLRNHVISKATSAKLGELSEIVPFAGFSHMDFSNEEELTTLNVCDVFIKVKTASAKNSYADMLAGEASESVGSAGAYVIHSWRAPFKSLHSSLETLAKKRGEDVVNSFVWLDLFCVNQHEQYKVTQEWLTATLCEAIGSIGCSIIVLADWKFPEPFFRSWCIWEILGTIQQGAELQVALPENQRAEFNKAVFENLNEVIKISFSHFDSEHARAANQPDEHQIAASIRDSIGFLGANLVVRDRLLEWLSSVGDEQVKNASTVNDRLATASFCLRLAKIMSGAQGKHGEAEVLLRRALDTRTVELGAAHSDTIEVAIALANVFRAQGKLSESELTLRRVCESLAKTKGDDDVETLMALGSLSRVLLDRGNFVEAEDICRDLLEMCEKKLGENDRRTLETLVTLSQLSDLKCDSNVAAKYLRRAVAGFEVTFGSKSVQTLNLKADLAGFLAELENFDEAESLFRESAQGLVDVLGHNHEWTVKAETGLAVLLKVKEAVGKDHKPAKYASPDAVMKPSSTPEKEKPNVSGGGKSVTITTPPPPNNNVSKKVVINEPINSSDPPATQAAQEKPAGLGKFASDQLQSFRASRLENMGQSKKNVAGAGASKKHLRGYLEKLPLELSQREREIQRKIKLRSNASAAGTSMMMGGAAGGGSTVGRGMLSKLGSMAGSVVGIGSKRLSFSKRANSDGGGEDGLLTEVNYEEMNSESKRKALIAANWRKRFFQVQSNMKSSSLVYWLTEDDCRNGKDKKGDFTFDDSNSRIFEKSPFGPLAFSITGPKGRLHLRAATAEDKAKWIDHITAALNFRGAAEKSKLFDGNNQSSIIRALEREVEESYGGEDGKGITISAKPNGVKMGNAEFSSMVVNLADLANLEGHSTVFAVGEQPANVPES